jgi:hypothetical protein
VAQDLEHLREIDDEGDDLHGLVASRAAQGIRLVDLLDQASPTPRSTVEGGAALLG